MPVDRNACNDTDVRHAEERDYAGPRFFSDRIHAGPNTLCGISFQDLSKPHWVVRPDSSVNCPTCLALLIDSR